MNAPNETAAIAEHAYFKWEAEGRPDGRAETHWLEAEQEILARKDRSDSPDEAAVTSSVEPTGTGEMPGRPNLPTLASLLPAPPRFVVTLDRAHLRIYRANETPGPSSVHLHLEQAFDLPAGKARYTANESDQAGRFPGLRGAPRDVAASSGGSIDERLPLQNERQRRIAAHLARQLEQFLQQHPHSTWDYAAAPALHRAVLDRLSPAVRGRLGFELAKDLVNQPIEQLRAHFAPAPANSP